MRHGLALFHQAEPDPNSTESLRVFQANLSTCKVAFCGAYARSHRMTVRDAIFYSTDKIYLGLPYTINAVLV